ncbi:acyl homoserine lactone synthase [Rhodovulum sp. ES.010]|uniref:acyl-homoserine-lactone synthase n=1 Tax=Rhodovulum sp. ES.010 TaxID=1882821 RepID=UPI000928D16F|nr:acyl-homoserine-lactone synthase [Rhodovulum sp. ES.010]SIO03728.1 acyl homoserine lactone synthase [Rhodovulum sp. ES.010]
MQTLTFTFSDLHQHGTAFYDFLALRKRVFVDQLGWDVPHDGTVEMDQYDTPQAHYSVVIREGRMVGGARCMPTTSTWGPHTYMLRDAYQGKLPHIPPRIMPEDIASPGVWECTRLVIDDSLETAADRAGCLRLIVDGLVGIARSRGATQMICLSSLALMRGLRQIGYDVRQMGESYRNEEDGRRYAVLGMPARYAREAQPVAEPARAA